ncbi:endoplasmic reticulum protein [Pyrenophora tritici-repentis]|uniref:Endoplasmic reticulum transmembrane protein n=1 Tax=Pyrenophora tritici-repentis TaxID=45151 RepID=A0A2W1FHS0_9PLEO|nr:Endoplasmic reticulum protein [Pyrenophora tritici-repentis]KAF7568951.1 endoplasmic reticulum protein [Pyrenophora tritici-repentis]KAG9375735.1 hypothetical protein A1F94_013684 [Pyrenophora tritici-repentis]KAI0581404.1 Endoplasmic reticulum protein [Pyrenophora tritici-repentis]KAI0610204.1 Endoplasmic reticulum protein [Pyrenophora tritici-repentis]
MTLYYSLVFLLLVTEMLIFCALIVPLPFTWRRKLFTFISESPIIAKLQYGMKITFIFILILFIDSVNRVYRVQIELSGSDDQGRSGVAAGGIERMEVQARKFYSQRNMGDPAGKKGKSAKDIGAPGEVADLRKELEAKDRDMANLKKQVENMQKEYNRMGDEVAGKQ